MMYKKKKGNNRIILSLTIMLIIMFFISSVLYISIGLIMLLGLISWILLVVYLTLKKLPSQINLTNETVVINNKSGDISTYIASDLEWCKLKNGIVIQEAKTGRFILFCQEGKWPIELIDSIKKRINIGEQKKRVNVFVLLSIFG